MDGDPYVLGLQGALYRLIEAQPEPIAERWIRSFR